jgi:hypothetical protein
MACAFRYKNLTAQAFLFRELLAMSVGFKNGISKTMFLVYYVANRGIPVKM